MIRSLTSLALLLSLGFVASCTTSVPPKVRVVTPIAEFGSGRIFIEANRDVPRIQEAFRAAGLKLAAGPAGADLIVKGRLGKSRGGSECGPVHNVQFQLFQKNYVILHIIARGPMGHCPQSVPDQIANEVAQFLTESRANIAGPPPAPAPLPAAAAPPTPAAAAPQPAAAPPEPEVTAPVRTDVSDGDAPAPRQQLGGAD